MTASKLVSTNHEKCHADHFSQQPGSGALQVIPSEQAVNFIQVAGMPLCKNTGIG
jgi:hypothetical protein